jgi:pimeloyl-ACP methyl ester carboxylesterase
MRLSNLDTIAKFSFPDMDFDRALAVAQSMPNHSAISFRGKVTYPGYRFSPVSWIFCENDFIIPPETQQKYIDRIQEETGKQVDVHPLATGHCPNSSAPEKLADLIVKIAAST